MADYPYLDSLRKVPDMTTKRQELVSDRSCLSRAGEDEPIFVLRAKDPIAAIAVRIWVTLANDRGIHMDRVEEAELLADQMDFWRKHNP